MEQVMPQESWTTDVYSWKLEKLCELLGVPLGRKAIPSIEILGDQRLRITVRRF